MAKTSKNHGHQHEWFLNRTFTTINAGHKHRVDQKTGMALSANGHAHRLLGMSSDQLSKKKKRYT